MTVDIFKSGYFSDVSKWEQTGLLEELNVEQKSLMAVLLENTARMMLEQEKNTNTTFPMNQIILPLVRRVFGELMKKYTIETMSIPAWLTKDEKEAFIAKTHLIPFTVVGTQELQTNTAHFWNLAIEKVEYHKELVDNLTDYLGPLLEKFIEDAAAENKVVYWYVPIQYAEVNNTLHFTSRFGQV